MLHYKTRLVYRSSKPVCASCIWQEKCINILFSKSIIRRTREEMFSSMNFYIKGEGLEWKRGNGAWAMCRKNSILVTRVPVVPVLCGLIVVFTDPVRGS